MVKLLLVNGPRVSSETVIYRFSCFLRNTKIKDLFCSFLPFSDHSFLPLYSEALQLTFEFYFLTPGGK